MIGENKAGNALKLYRDCVERRRKSNKIFPIKQTLDRKEHRTKVSNLFGNELTSDKNVKRHHNTHVPEEQKSPKPSKFQKYNSSVKGQKRNKGYEETATAKKRKDNCNATQKGKKRKENYEETSKAKFYRARVD